MTVNDVYEESLSFLMEKPHEDELFFENALNLINAGLFELTPVQNSVNRAEGKAEKAEYRVSAFSDEIPLDAPLAKLLPLYLASHFYRDDLDERSASEFYSRFTEGKKTYTRASFADISDLYGGENL